MIETITKDNIIDTTDLDNVEKYKHNLELLIKEAKEKGFIDKFALIRNDDFYPYNDEWIINSEYTNDEFRSLGSIPKRNNEPVVKKGFFGLFKKKEEIDISKLEYDNVYFYHPVEFRSTKHFTVNTSLGTTAEYNLVKFNRKFTIIDGIDNFLNSGYGYSLSARDAYLDVTHEPLKVSENAIVLISIDTYNEIKDNKELMEQISRKKLIIYKGDLDTAINMILTENGILPTRTEYKYDSDLEEIIKNSFIELCNRYNLEYDRPHGMRGHFTSYIDQFDEFSLNYEKELLKFIKDRFNSDLLDNIHKLDDFKFLLSSGKVRIEEIKPIIDEFNNIKKIEFEQRKKQYLEDRKKITPEISELFKNTIQLIREHENDIPFCSEDIDIAKAVNKFYVAPDVDSQVRAALEIRQYFIEYENENNKQY